MSGVGVVQSPIGGYGQQFTDSSGNVLSGGKLYSYVAGSTTPLTTYTSVAGDTPNSNPIIFDSGGRVASGGVWLISGSSYKFVVKTSADVVVGTYDNITGLATSFTAVSALPTASLATLAQGYIVLSDGVNPTTGWLGITLVDGTYGFYQLF